MSENVLLSANKGAMECVGQRIHMEIIFNNNIQAVPYGSAVQTGVDMHPGEGIWVGG